MSISDTIAWLRRLAVVSCPEISCQQAAEVAATMEAMLADIELLDDRCSVYSAETGDALDEIHKLKTLLDLEEKANGIAMMRLNSELGHVERLLAERDAAIKERDEALMLIKNMRASLAGANLMDRADSEQVLQETINHSIALRKRVTEERDALKAEVERLKVKMAGLLVGQAIVEAAPPFDADDHNGRPVLEETPRKYLGVQWCRGCGRAKPMYENNAPLCDACRVGAP